MSEENKNNMQPSSPDTKSTVMRERDLKKTAANQTVGHILVKVMVYTFLIIMAIVVIFPSYWVINSSLKTPDG